MASDRFARIADGVQQTTPFRIFHGEETPAVSSEPIVATPHKMLNKLVWENTLPLLLYGTIVIVCGVIAWYFMKSIMRRVAEWSEQRTFVLTSQSPRFPATSSTASVPVRVSSDDVVYPEINMEKLRKLGVKITPSASSMSDIQLLKNRMQKLKSKYASYNEALAKYLGESDKPVDDIIDEHIFSDKNQAYKYQRSKHDDA